MAKTEYPTNFTFLDKLPTFYRRQLQTFGTFLNEMHSDFTPIYPVICYIIFIRLAIKYMPLNSTFKVRKITFISQTLKTEAVRYCLSRYGGGGGWVKFDPQTKYIGCIVNVTCNGMNNIMRNTQKRMLPYTLCRHLGTVSWYEVCMFIGNFHIYIYIFICWNICPLLIQYTF